MKSQNIFVVLILKLLWLDICKSENAKDGRASELNIVNHKVGSYHKYGLPDLYSQLLVIILTLISSHGFSFSENLKIDNANSSAIELQCPSITRIHVDSSAVLGGDGTSWAMAMDSLQEAIDLACECSIDTIWVAQGTYFPSKDSLGNIPADPRDATFFFDKEIYLYGGFLGSEGSLAERNFKNNKPTILSGAIGTNADTDNSKNIVITKNVVNGFVMDGFTLSDGYGSSGSGWYHYVDNAAHISSPIARNCQFINNHASSNGGAFSLGFDAKGTHYPMFLNCSFESNSSSSGGALDFTGFVGTIEPRIYNSRFYDNTAGLGGAISGTGQAVKVIISNASFSSNYSTIANGGDVIAMITEADIDMINCIVWGNNAPSGNEHDIELNSASNVLMAFNCLFEENVCPTYGTCNLYTLYEIDPLFVNMSIGDLRLQECSPAINSGTTNQALVNDLDCNVRPVGLFDMGAYEYQSTPPLITWYKDKDKDGFTDGKDSLSCGQPADYESIVDISGFDCDSIFFDGFESGNTSGWSSTAPFKEDAPTKSGSTGGGVVTLLDDINGPTMGPHSGILFFGQTHNDAFQTQLFQDFTLPNDKKAMISFYQNIMYNGLSETGILNSGFRVSIRPQSGGAFTIIYQGQSIDFGINTDQHISNWQKVEIDLNDYLGGSWRIKVEAIDINTIEYQYGLDSFFIESCDFLIDCNDMDTNIYPGAAEVCNNVDDNCNNQTDENDICCAGFLVVSNTDDDGCGSLRYAIENAVNGDTITFDPNIDGDTIKVTSEEIRIEKDLVIIGNDTLKTIIDGCHTHRIFEIRDHSVEIKGVKFQRGYSDEQGGAIDNRGDLLIAECLFDDNVSTSNPNFSTAIKHPSKYRHSQRGGAIYSVSNSRVRIINSSFKNNTAENEGGAIYFRSNGLLKIEYSSFSDNTSSSEGGALHFQSDSIYILNSHFVGNEAAEGGALFNDSNDKVFIDSSEFRNNKSTVEGGAIFNYYSDTLCIDHSRFYDNQSIEGGAISTEAEIYMVINNSLFNGNVASSINLNLANSITKSSATLRLGGAISGDGDDKVYIFENVDFTHNMADDRGGAINIGNGDTLIMNNCEISSNTITTGFGSGGGIYSQGELLMSRCEVIGNSSLDDGGGIYTDGLYMRRCRVSGNTGEGEFGGGIRMEEGYIINSIISGNSGVDQGGGIICTDEVSIINSTITGNQSKQTGGGIENQGTMELVNSIVAKNMDTQGSPDIFNSGTITSMNNLIGDGSGQTAIVHNQNGNQVGTNAQPIDPMFINDVPADDSLGGDFQLTCNSMARDSGRLDTSGLMLGQVDYIGSNRIFGQAIDVGAFELQNVCADLKIMGSSVVCPGQADEVYHTNMTQAQCNSASFNWILNGIGLTILSGQGTHSITVGFGNGVINAELILESMEGAATLKDTLNVIGAPPVICELSNCADSSHLTTGVLISNTVPDIISTSRVITSDAVVFSKDYEFRAGQSIEFLPDFQVVMGREFIADIMPCVNAGSLTDQNVKFLLKAISDHPKSHISLTKSLTCALDIDNDNICDDVDDCIDLDGDGYGIGGGCIDVDCFDDDPLIPINDKDCDGITTAKDCDDNDAFIGRCDMDNDGVPDEEDNCPETANPNQSDINGNGVGDECEIIPHCGSISCSDGDPCTVNDQWTDDCQCVGVYRDKDKDGVCDFYDECEGYDDYRDWDEDGIPDGCDVDPACTDCEQDENGTVTICWIPFIEDNMKTVNGDCEYLSKFFDTDGRLQGKTECGPCSCALIDDVDSDEDGVCDRKDECPENPDLITATECGCESISDICDHDNDGVRDPEDNCPNTPNPDQSDSDEDGIGDPCDLFNCVTGSSCDDGKECTINDKYDDMCNCVGEEADDDLDGICNVLDQCHGFKDYEDDDNDGIPNGCDIQDECGSCQPDNRGRITICKLTSDRKSFVNISGRCNDLDFLFDEYGDFISPLYSCGQCECEMIGDTDSDGNGICDSKEK